MFEKLPLIEPEYQKNLTKLWLIINLALMLVCLLSLSLYLWLLNQKAVYFEFVKVDPSGLIERISSENEIKGDQVLLKNYLKKYVQTRENEWPYNSDHTQAQMQVVKAFSNHQVFNIYQNRRNSQHIRKAKIQKIEQLNPELYQVYFISQQEDGSPEEKIATVGVRLLKDFNGNRLEIPNVLQVNPLKIEIYSYNTAKIITDDESKL